MDCLLSGGARTLHVIAPTHINGAQSIGIVLGEAPIRNALLVYARARRRRGAVHLRRDGGLGVCQPLLLSWCGRCGASPARWWRSTRIRKMRAVFSQPRSRADEIGLAERELAAMQRDLYGFLRQKARLAALGAAVARIQHDLRNILATAQLASDRLAASEDPVVKRLTPSLVTSIDRAIALATNTLKFGSAEERMPQKTPIDAARIDRGGRPIDLGIFATHRLGQSHRCRSGG